jgi:thiamine biosynthesis lipoprotein
VSLVGRTANPTGATWPALGTSARVVVAALERLAAARTAVEAELRAIDRACSRFRPDAELVALNAAGGAPTRTSPLLFEALEVALDAARATGGAVDPTVGAALERAGYDRDLAAIAPDGPPLPTAPAPAAGWRSVCLDRITRTAAVPIGTRLDLGATAKALAADRAAEAAAAAAGCGVVVSLGGDVSVAGEAPDGGWPVAIGDDHAAPGGPVVTIQAGGLATSSTVTRRWRRGGHDVHHIIDPSTGAPCAEVWRTATVAAATCVQANVASTAAIVLGAAAPPWLEARGLPARLVRRGGEVVPVGPWPDESV